MSSTYNFFNIPDQKGVIESISQVIKITNIGIEAITNIYDDRMIKICIIFLGNYHAVRVIDIPM